MPHPTPPLLTRRALLSLGGGLLGLAGAGFLAACGATTATQAAVPTRSSTTAAATGASSAPVAASATPSMAGAGATLPPFNGIPQGRTPDGFPFLNRSADENYMAVGYAPGGGWAEGRSAGAWSTLRRR